MKNSSYSKAKVLTLIPIFVLAVTVICLVLAAILEAPTGRGVLYTIFAFAGLMSMFFCRAWCCLLRERYLPQRQERKAFRGA